MSFAEDCSGLKAIALSKLKCQLEELQQHNTDLSADNQRLKDKNCALQQVRKNIAGDDIKAAWSYMCM
jgi:hypothetical protein